MKQGSDRGYTLVELVVVMAVIGATFYVVLPRLSAALVADPLRDTVRYLSQTTSDLRAKAVLTQQRQILFVDLDNNRLFTGGQPSSGPSVKRPAPEKAYALGADLSLTGLHLPQRQRLASGAVPVCFHPQGHSDQVIIHLARADGQRFSLYINPFLPEIEIRSGLMDYADLLAGGQ